MNLQIIFNKYECEFVEKTLWDNLRHQLVNDCNYYDTIQSSIKLLKMLIKMKSCSPILNWGRQ